MSDIPVNSKFNIEFIESLFNISWLLMDYTRDRRYRFEPGKAIKPRKDVPGEILQAIVDLNAMTSHILACYNKPAQWPMSKGVLTNQSCP